MTQEPASLPAPVANPSGMITEPVDSALPTKRARMADTFLMAFAAGLVVLTASFVARNSDVWQHLSVGRLIAGGQYDFATDPLGYATSDASWVNHFWLTDWLWYQIFQRLGGSALVGLKAICLLLAIIVALPKGRPNQPRWLSAFWVALAVVALSPRAALQPLVASCLFLALTIRWLRVPATAWRVPMLTVVWVNVDEWFLLAPLLAIAHWAAERFHGNKSIPITIPAISLLACLASPFHIRGLTLPTELSPALWSSELMSDPRVAAQFSSYFTANPFTGEHSDSPAFWAFVALALFGGMLIASHRRTAGFAFAAIWMITLGLAAWQTRLVPLFAVTSVAALSGVVQEFTPTKRLAGLGRGAVLLAILGFGALAWGGWLQGSRGRDRVMGLAIWADPSIINAGKRLQSWRTANQIDAAARVLCTTPDATSTLMWFSPGEKGYLDTRWDFHARAGRTSFPGLIAPLALPEGADETVASPGGLSEVSAILLADPSAATFEQLSAKNPRWKIVAIDGRALWLTASGRAAKTPQLSEPGDRETIEDRQAFAPTAILEQRPTRYPKYREWWLPSSSQRLAENALAAEAATHLNLQIASKSQNPAGPLLAVRSARQAIAINPDDGAAWLELARAYSLLAARVENRLANASGMLKELRRAQRVTALNQAVICNPESEAARDALAAILGEVGYADLSLRHRRVQLGLARRRGDRTRTADLSELVAAMENDLLDRESLFHVRTPGMSGDPLGRARIAISLGLASQAIDILLKSSPDLYGADGLKLLTGLLIGSGQAAEAHTLLHRDEIRKNPAQLGVHEIVSLSADGQRIVYRVAAYEWFQFMLAASAGVTSVSVQLEQMEKQLIGEVGALRGVIQRIRPPLAITLAIETGLAPTGMWMPRFINGLRREEFLVPIAQSRLLIAEHGDLKALEACIALESGDRLLAQKCLDIARSDYAKVGDLRVTPAKDLAEMYWKRLADFPN